MVLLGACTAVLLSATFLLLSAAAFDASAPAGLVAAYWKTWALAVAGFKSS